MIQNAIATNTVSTSSMDTMIPELRGFFAMPRMARVPSLHTRTTIARQRLIKGSCILDQLKRYWSLDSLVV